MAVDTRVAIEVGILRRVGRLTKEEKGGTIKGGITGTAVTDKQSNN